jgi:prophage regulatory protein
MSNHPSAPRILRLKAAEDKSGLKRSAIYQKIAEGTFPRPIPLGEKAVGWLESEIDGWIAERTAEREYRQRSRRRPPASMRDHRKEA